MYHDIFDNIVPMYHDIFNSNNILRHFAFTYKPGTFSFLFELNPPSLVSIRSLGYQILRIILSWSQAFFFPLYRHSTFRCYLDPQNTCGNRTSYTYYPEVLCSAVVLYHLALLDKMPQCMQMHLNEDHKLQNTEFDLWCILQIIFENIVMNCNVGKQTIDVIFGMNQASWSRSIYSENLLNFKILTYSPCGMINTRPGSPAVCRAFS